MARLLGKSSLFYRGPIHFPKPTSSLSVDKNLHEAIKNQTTFSLQLAKHVMHQEDNDSNVVFSPLSIHAVLGLMAAGSGGETRSQLLSLLRSQSVGEVNSLSSKLVASVLADGSRLGGPKTSYANSIWIQDHLPLKPSFKDIADNVYRASVKPVDFTTKSNEIVRQVNTWAEKETEGLITNILSENSVDSLTRLIFANALYFKGAWLKEFNTSETREYDFHLLNGTSARGVAFMTSEDSQRFIGAYDGFKVLCLPYRRGEEERSLSMFMILPDAKDGLPALIEKVTSEPGFLDPHLNVDFVPAGEFRIPKFKISFGFEAGRVLKGLGVDALFRGGLTEMVNSPEGQPLFVSGIFHTSFIQVDEKGTEAAAITTSCISGSSLNPRFRPVPIDFVADHPFLFLIREDITGVVLFIGSVLNPTISS